MNFVFKDGKIEAEDFTSRLYRELNSSPQPYLVPFLKVIRSPLRAPSVGWWWAGSSGEGWTRTVVTRASAAFKPLRQTVKFSFWRLSCKFRDPHCCYHNVVLHLRIQKGPVPLEGGPCARG